ncbi:hypothetical protein CQ11_03395 [Trueperella pyogenes]|uniref:hypothetical protein n=1 Tax=Trueperella pyogenes TaxID=1661 RepID=UPI00043ABB5F|nr:hypothetical protein [Trueperella pyogenes]AHU89188.1 hypothetical protein CQ11_03395 [Trueperella pyogenes]AWA43127.1 hypothetical protein DBV13_03370 [Trueperella pyogenes]
MIVTEANRYISALNRIAEGAAMLAQAIEESAWESFEDHAGMPGARPIAAAQLAQSALEEAAEEYEATQQPGNRVPDPEPAKAEEPESEPVSLEQVRAVLARLSQAGHTAKVRELIQMAGAAKLSEVDPAKYGWLLSRAEAMTDA